MDVIVTYDIKRNHTEIKDELKTLGYRDATNGFLQGTTTPVVHELPNTTLIKYDAAGTESILNQVLSVINKHNGGLDRLFCAQLAQGFNWSGRNN